jgi:hypothetical protein
VADYREHDQLHPGDVEQAAEDAACEYLAPDKVLRQYYGNYRRGVPNT